jgi:hypothetical protein
MKLARMLFIFLIGMISFTALGSTTMLEQKPKGTIEQFVKTDVVVSAIIFEQNSIGFEFDKENKVFLVSFQKWLVTFNKTFKQTSNSSMLKIPINLYRDKFTAYNYSIDKDKYFSTLGIRDSKRYLCSSKSLSLAII